MELARFIKRICVSTSTYKGVLAEEYYDLIDWIRGPVAKLYRKAIIDEHHLRFDENLSVAETKFLISPIIDSLHLIK